MTPSDAELMTAVCSRDAAAFEVLELRYRDSVRRHLVGIVRDPASAEDLLQEVLLRVWARADQWDGRGALQAWLFRIATNTAMNHMRTVRRRRECSIEPAAAGPAQAEDAAVASSLVTSRSLRPDAVVETAEQSTRLRVLIDRLPEQKRNVVRLACEDGLDLREVAERLDIPEGTARSRLHYARKWLLRRWQETEMEGEDER